MRAPSWILKHGFSIFGLWLALHAALASAATPRKLFLSIGIGAFQDSRWPQLNFPGKDALDMTAALRPGFEAVAVLSDRERPEPIRRDEVLKALEELAQQNRSEDDTIIVYISTHGTLAQSVTDGRRAIAKFLVMGDTQYDRVAETGLKIPALIERFRVLKSRRKALIIDACYSGQGKAHITPAMLEFMARQKGGTLQPPIEDVDESTAVYSASAWGEEAQEDAHLQNGVYTHFLLKSFKEDLNGDGAVQLSEAHTQATSLVIEYTKGAQHPAAQVEIVGQDPVVLSGEIRKGGQPTLLAWRRDLRNYLVSFNGKALGSLKKGILNLPEGQGRLELYDPGTQQLVHTTKVDLQANETYLLESFLAEDRPHHLRLLAGSSWFTQKNARERISSEALAFFGVGYQYQDALDWADVGISVIRLDSRPGTVEIAEKRLGEPIGLQRASQRLNGMRVDLALRRESRLPALSDAQRHWQTHWVSALGPSYLRLERRFPELNERDVSGSVGLNLEQGFQVVSNFRHLSWEVIVQYALFQDQWSDSGKPVGLLTATTGLGMAL